MLQLEFLTKTLPVLWHFRIAFSATVNVIEYSYIELFNLLITYLSSIVHRHFSATVISLENTF